MIWMWDRYMTGGSNSNQCEKIKVTYTAQRCKKGGIYSLAKLLKWKVFNNFNQCNKMLLQIILQISKSCPYVVIKVQHLPKFLNALALFSVHNGVKSLMKFIWFSRTPLQFSQEPVFSPHVWWILAMGLADLLGIADMHCRKVESTKWLKYKLRATIGGQ